MITHLLDLNLVLVNTRTLDFRLVLRRGLDDTFDYDDGLPADSLCPPDHVVRHLALLFSQDRLYGCDLLPEDEENDLGSCPWR